jgi:peptide/nickel transport system substrate-binding protein
MRRLLSLLIAASLLGMCGARGAELRIGLSADVTSMDPHFLNLAPNNNIAWHVFDALTHVDNDARLIPGLATSWRTIDPTTWEFKLRPGVKFHDGSALTADDVAFSIERSARLPNGQFGSFTRRIVATRIVDAHTLRLKTAAPYAMLPYDLDSVFIVSKKAAAGATSADFDSGRAMLGSGPFRFVRFARGDRVELARNDAYWGARDKKLTAWERVTFRIIPSDPARLAALLAGDVDLIDNLPTADAAKLKSDPRYELVRKVSWRTLFFTLDQERDAPPFVTDKSGKPLVRNPFKDLRVRRAISMAINRGAIAERVMEGLALPAANIVSPPVFGYAPALKPEPYDPDGAKRLLAQAGYAEGFGLTLHAPNNRYVNDEQIAQAVAQMLARVGIRTQVETMPMAVYLGKARRREFSFAMLGWGSFSGELALRTLLATPNADKGTGAWNWGGYSNARGDALLERALATAADAKREALAREAAVLMLGDLGVVPLHHQIAVWALRRGLAYPGRTDEFTFAHQVLAK